MNHSKSLLLSTKALSPAQVLLLEASGWKVLMHNFISIQWLPLALQLPYDLLICTSQNAVHSLLQHPQVALLKNTPLYCVGKNTQKLLEPNGFKVLYATDYATELVAYLQTQLPLLKEKKHIGFLAGTHRLNTLPTFFSQEALKVEELCAYRTLLTPIKLEASPQAILFFSPSGVESYCQENVLEAQQQFYCIGTTTANAVRTHFPALREEQLFLPPTPTVADVVASVQKPTYF